MPKSLSNPKPPKGGSSAKAAAALLKQTQQTTQLAAAESTEWTKGAKDTSKQSSALAKRQLAASARAERDAILAAEEETGNKSAKAGKKGGVKAEPPRKVPEWSEEEEMEGPLATLSATGIDAALSLMSVTNAAEGDDDKEASRLERHPERRVKAAWVAFEKRRMGEMDAENGNGNLLRRTQRIELIRREFEKSAENPWNQVHVAVGMGAEERREVVRGVRRGEEEGLREK